MAIISHHGPSWAIRAIIGHHGHHGPSWPSGTISACISPARVGAWRAGEGRLLVAVADALDEEQPPTRACNHKQSEAIISNQKQSEAIRSSQ